MANDYNGMSESWREGYAAGLEINSSVELAAAIAVIAVGWQLLFASEEDYNDYIEGMMQGHLDSDE